VSLVAAAITIAACGGDREAPVVTSPAPGAPPSPAAPVAARRWSDPATWPGNALPAAGASVTIPAGTTIELDTTPPPLAIVRVEGTLTVAARPLALTADAVHVRAGGALRVGSADAPHRHPFTLTLTGDADAQVVPGAGGKVLAIDGGTLEMHAEPRTSWLRLGATAEGGATTIRLERAVDWRVGDRIAIASSSLLMRDVEQRTITQVDGPVVTLDQPLAWRHWGTVQTIAGAAVDERAEVALLSRIVVVRGDEASETTLMGGHLIAMNGATLRLDGVELFRMGQRGRLARYPVHWHMMGSAAGQYVKRSSVRRSYHRCITVHGTGDVAVEDNVCVDHGGHGYFLEDGSETGNRFLRNVAMLTQRLPEGSRSLPSDGEPASFWITNPANDFVGNVATSSFGKGFWYALPLRPTGLSTGQPHWPATTPAGRFDDNVAHSNQGEGFYIDERPRPDGTLEGDAEWVARQVPADTASPIVPLVFRRNVMYKHEGRSIWYRARRIRLVDWTFADNSVAVDGANSSSHTSPDSLKAIVDGGLVVGLSANREPLRGWALLHRGVRGIETYDGRIMIRRTHFANFRATDGGPMTTALSMAQNDQLGYLDTPLASGVRFTDARPFLTLGLPATGSYTWLHQDGDGSITGVTATLVAGPYPVVLTPACTPRPDLEAHLCTGRYLQHSVEHDGRPPTSRHRLVRDDGATDETHRDNAPLLEGRRYEWRFGGTRPATMLAVVVHDMTPSEWVGLWLPVPGRPASAVRDRWHAREAMTEASSPAEVDAGTGTRWYHDAAGGRIYVKAMRRDAASVAALTYLFRF
jgi:cell migration-inducing and hyaluronan-binding protein